MQPWAAAIVAERKTIEHRSWTTRHRGRLWIHAGRQLDVDGDAPELSVQLAPLVFGAIIGHVTLTRITGSPGAYEWHLADPHELAEAVPARGWPALWRWPG